MTENVIPFPVVPRRIPIEREEPRVRVVAVRPIEPDDDPTPPRAA